MQTYIRKWLIYSICGKMDLLEAFIDSDIKNKIIILNDSYKGKNNE